MSRAEDRDAARFGGSGAGGRSGAAVHDAEFRAAEASLAASATKSESPFGPPRSDNGLKLKLVAIDKGLWMGATEVTQSEWTRIVGGQPRGRAKKGCRWR